MHEYLDFLSGISVSSVGHCHPHVVSAIQDQAGRLLHVGNLYFTEPMTKLADRLASSSLGGGVFFTNSGAEANEAALKLVRKAKPGGDIVVCHGGFHGRTYGALSATPQESKQAPFAPLVPGFRPVEPTAEAITGAVDERTAAVVLEVIQGESGVHPLSAQTLQAARDACDAVGAALVFDEVQTGMGRTGSLWAYEQVGVVPDALTTAKALGGGLPIGALVTGERLEGVFAPGDHGSTFAGGPVVAAAALAVFDIVDDAELMGRVAVGRRASARAPGGAARGGRGARPRPDERLRPGRWQRPRRGPPRAAGAAPGGQRHRPADRAPAAAADGQRRRARRGGRPAPGAPGALTRPAHAAGGAPALRERPGRLDRGRSGRRRFG